MRDPFTPDETTAKARKNREFLKHNFAALLG
jgi:hypothetical protein